MTGVNRQIIGLIRVQLTDLVVKCPRNSTVKNLNKAWKEGDILAKWSARLHQTWDMHASETHEVSDINILRQTMLC